MPRYLHRSLKDLFFLKGIAGSNPTSLHPVFVEREMKVHEQRQSMNYKDEPEGPAISCSLPIESF